MIWLHVILVHLLLLAMVSLSMAVVQLIGYFAMRGNTKALTEKSVLLPFPTGSVDKLWSEARRG